MTHRISRFLTVFLTFALIAFSAGSAHAQGKVTEISIEGAQRIEASTILSYMDIRPGDTLERDALDNAVKSLFSTGLFADVTLKQSGGTLIVNVVENPVINKIAFEGNDQVDDEELMAEIQLRPRQVFTRTKVQADVSRIYQVYRRSGRFSILVEPKVIRLDQNRVNLVFEITEGDLTTVSSIRFVGNKRFDDAQLRGEITTKESRWYRFFAADDRYDPDRLAFDQEQLRKFYLSEGYADFELISAVAELSDKRDHFFITFTLEEGQRYKVNKIDIDSRLKDFDASVLNEEMRFAEGDWYNANLVQETVDHMTDRLGDLQYAFVNVRSNVERNKEEATVDITFQINEAPRVFVERIDISGNLRTQDRVIRREILLSEADPYNRSKLARSEQRVRDLNYFETVDLDVKPGSAPDKTVVDVNVSEKSTGELSVGAGFSTSDGPLADISITERNLLGKGQSLRLSAIAAAERSELQLSFTEPYFTGRDVSAGFDLFHTIRDLQDESSFDQRRTGGALRVGYPLSERWRQTLRYRAERNEITDVDNTASLFIRQQEGVRDTSALSSQIVYDNRDSKIFPTDGWLIWFDTEVAGLGGDAQYVSGKTGTSYFYPIADNWVFNTLGEVGAIEAYGDEIVQINERFFLGGSSLRGFERSGIGPRDSVTADSLGGNRFYRGSVELTMPTPLPEEYGFRSHLFSDFGSLWDVDDASGVNLLEEETVRASVGVGLSWRSPFGPIRADFSTPIAEEDFDETESFRFDFGTRF